MSMCFGLMHLEIILYLRENCKFFKAIEAGLNSLLDELLKIGKEETLSDRRLQKLYQILVRKSIKYNLLSLARICHLQGDCGGFE